MDRFNERLCALAALGCLFLAALDVAWRSASRLEVFTPLAAWLGACAGVAALVFARERLRRGAAEERQDAERARQERPDAALFAREEGAPGGEPFSIGRTRARFEQWAVRAAAPLLALALGLAAWQFGRFLALLPAGEPVRRLAAAAFLAAQGFGLLVFSRYLLGLARDPDRRLLRGPGAALGLAALGSALALAACLAGEAGQAWADRAGALALGAALAVLAAELALNTIVDAYRPRRPGEPCVAYESRLGRWLCDPSGLARGAAQSLDYQFGFKVSQTWFYRFLAAALAPLLCFQLVGMYLLSCCVFLGPEEEGILERMGRPRAEAEGGWRLGSGAHLKRPWPFDRVLRFPVRRLQATHIGYTSPGEDLPPVLLWTRAHFQQEDQFVFASRTAADSAGPDAPVPVNLLSVNVPIEYRIADLYAYAYGSADPAAELRVIAYRSLTREAAGRDLFDVLGPGQKDLARALRARIQEGADRAGLGVEVTFVGVQGVHPPVAVAGDFEAVVGALEEKEARVLEAKAYRSRLLPAALAEATNVVLQANAYARRRAVVSEAEAAQFVSRKAASDRSPAVFRSRYALDAVARALKGARLYVVAAGADSSVFQFNFEEKLPPSLFDLSPPPEKKP